ncbi:MAG: hypothetical protein FXF47_06790 [Candidatus Mcinerneyibacterium aminivorans]|jgi:ribosomal protein S3AE|uniref:Uncharacterized protein n=1 Tax=Candidatus Mcinerneyibacterium aminivorans TaxID=2703815 RepID=A0A5D0MD12_9BACT|nr:MAG: hypothetical protein FXF47_06790 [Candidatus Mcinerneyibacterium aminivorans]
MNQKDNIKVPVFKQKLKAAVMKREKQKLEKKLVFYKKFAVAALILFVFTLTFSFLWKTNETKVAKKNKIEESISRYASEINFNTEADKKLEKIMINETIKSGKQIYPVKVKNIMVKKIELSNGKTIELESKIDMTNYANVY